MALHIILLGILLLIILGFFVFAYLSDHKVFFIGAFIVLMLVGIFIQSSGGLIIDQRVSDINPETLEVTYEDVVYDLTEPTINMFSLLLVLIGGVLTAFTTFSLMFTKPESSPFHY